MPASDGTQPRNRKSAPPSAGSCWGGVARLLSGAPPPRRKRAPAAPALEHEQPQQATSKEERLETGSSSNPQPPGTAPTVPEHSPNVPGEKRPEAATKAPAEVEALEPCKSARSLKAPAMRRRVDAGQVCQFVATFLIAIMQAVLMASYSTRWATSFWPGPHTALNAHHSTLNASCGRLLTLSQWCFLMTLCACLVEAAILVVTRFVLDESLFRLFDCLGFPPAGFGQGVASVTRLFIIGWSIQALISANPGELLVCHGLSSCTSITIATFLLLSMLNLNALVQWGRGSDKERSPLLRSEKRVDFGTGRRDSPIPRTLSSRSLV